MLINHIKKQKEDAQTEADIIPPPTHSDSEDIEEPSETASYVSEEDGEMFSTDAVRDDIETFLNEQTPF